MIKEVRAIHQMKWNYIRQFWPYIQWGIIMSSWTALGLYVWRYQEMTRIGNLFKMTSGSAYVNLQLATYIDDLLTFLLGISCFFASIKTVYGSPSMSSACLFWVKRYNMQERICFGFLFSFSIVFLAFIALFYLLFASKMWACANLLHTVQTLFEMILLKFDASEITSADAFLGPFAFTLFVLLLVFIGITMFISIINNSFRTVRKRIRMNANEDDQIFAFMWNRFLQGTGCSFLFSRHSLVYSSTGLKKASETDLNEAREKRIRSKYVDPVEQFPEKMDELLEALNLVGFLRGNEIQQE